jgi:4-azaleucine resistance transporter AzlC
LTSYIIWDINVTAKIDLDGYIMLTAEKPQIEARVTFNRAGAISGVQQSIALLVECFLSGAVFGIMARQAGLRLTESVSMSGFVFAGTSQYAALDLWITPLPLLTIILTTLTINLRYIMMGAALQPWLKRLSTSQIYGSLIFMGDESWALAMREFASGGTNASLMIGSGISQSIVWVSSTAFGYIVSTSIINPAKWGIDFVFTAAFVAILSSMWKGKSDLIPWGVSAAVALIISFILPGKWYILAGGVAGSVVGYLRSNHES